MLFITSQLAQMQHNSIQSNTILYKPRTNTNQYNAFAYATIEHNTRQYNAMQYKAIAIQHKYAYSTIHIQYNTMQHKYNTVQCITIEPNTVEHNTKQYNTTQYQTIQTQMQNDTIKYNPVQS